MDTFLIPVPPGQLRALQGWDVIPAYLAYRAGKGPHLFRAEGPPPPRGGLMVLGSRGLEGTGAAQPFCQEVVRECQARDFLGAVLDFELQTPLLEQIARTLDESFSRRNWQLYVPEFYGLKCPHARVAIPSALSGGSLERRLEEAQERFGGRAVLSLQVSAEDFFLPSPTGSGLPLAREELKALMERLSPSVFFSADLCARYFTYMDRKTGAHFVLFDDGDTLRRKVETARRAGIGVFLIPWQEAEPYAGQLLRRSGPGGASRP